MYMLVLEKKSHIDTYLRNNLDIIDIFICRKVFYIKVNGYRV